MYMHRTLMGTIAGDKILKLTRKIAVPQVEQRTLKKALEERRLARTKAIIENNHLVTANIRPEVAFLEWIEANPGKPLPKSQEDFLASRINAGTSGIGNGLIAVIERERLPLMRAREVLVKDLEDEIQAAKLSLNTGGKLRYTAQDLRERERELYALQDLDVLSAHKTVSFAVESSPSPSARRIAYLFFMGIAGFFYAYFYTKHNQPLKLWLWVHAIVFSYGIVASFQAKLETNKEKLQDLYPALNVILMPLASMLVAYHDLMIPRYIGNDVMNFIVHPILTFVMLSAVYFSTGSFAAIAAEKSDTEE